MTQSAPTLLPSRWQSARWLPAVLIASLALNLAVIGMVGGALLRGSPPPGPQQITPNLLGFTNTLPTDRRKALLEATAQERQTLRPFRRDVRIAREEVLKALVAEPFNKDAYIAAQTQLGEKEERSRAAVHELFARLAERMTPQERQAFKRWREFLRPPGYNMLDEPDRQAGERPSRPQ